MAAECWEWLSDEPFAVEPALFGSFGASTGARSFDEAVRFARAGLAANPSNQELRNNLVFALVHRDRDGDLAEAVREFRKIGKPKEHGARIGLRATKGLLCYRRGDPKEGRRLYLGAITEAQEKSKSVRWRQAHPHVIVHASLFFVYEELRPGTRLQESKPVQKAWDRVQKSNRLPELTLWRDRIEAQMAVEAARRSFG